MTRTQLLLAAAAAVIVGAIVMVMTSRAPGGASGSAGPAGAGRRDPAAGGRVTGVEARAVDHVPGPALQHDDDPPGDQRLEGQVIDADQQPVAGATVVIDASPPREAATGEDGSFAFDGLLPRTYRLEARAADAVGGPVAVALSPTSEPVVIRLREASRLIVEVRGDGDAPLPDALVELRDLATVTAATGADGVAVLRGVGGGWHVVKASAPGHASAYQEVTTTGDPGDEKRITFRLRPGVAVSGTVVDGAGAPVEGARVLPEPVARIADVHDARLDGVLTDAKGRWRLIGLSRETLRVRAYHPGFAPGSTAPVPLLDGVDRDGLTIVLEKGARIAGRVVDVGGAPAPGAEVRVTGGERHGVVRRAVCDEAGRFELTGLARRRIHLVALSGDATSKVAVVDLAAGSAADLELRLEEVDAIAGVVVDSSGEPVGEARVVATPALSDDTMERAEQRLRGSPSVIADGDGRFRIGGLSSKDYLLRATRPGTASEILEMRAGAKVAAGTTDARIVVDDLAAIVGMVAYRDGGTPRELVITLGGAAPRHLANPDGSFRIEEVPAGKQYLRIDGPELVGVTRTEVTVAADGETDLGTITVERGRRIGGHVVDDAGRPLAGALVVVGPRLNADGADLAPWDDEGVDRVYSDEAGRFEVRGVGPGLQTVIADHDVAGRSTALEVAPDARDVDLTLVVRAPGAIQGFVRYAGQPADGVVTLRPAGAPNAGFHVKTGPDGSYRLDRVGAGEYLVIAGIARGTRESGEGWTSRRVTIAPGKVLDADFELGIGGVDVILELASPGDVVEFAYALVAVVPNGLPELELPTTVAAGRTMLAQLGDTTSREAIIVQDRQIDLRELPTGPAVACAAPLRGDPNDPATMQEVGDHIVEWPIYCETFTVTPEPARQVVIVEVQPLPPR